MRSSIVTRIHRRIIVKHFGGTRNFIVWFGAVLLVVYVIDTYFLTKDRLESFVGGPRSSENGQAPPGGEAAQQNQQPPVESINKPADSAQNVPNVAQQQGAQTGEKLCGLQEACPAGKYAYYIKSGKGVDGTPIICFNGHYAMSPEKANGHRGINLAVIDDKTKNVQDVRYFDTYIEDKALSRFLDIGVKESQVVLMTTLDEASFHLKADGKAWLHKFGSSVADKLAFRDSFALVGQKGLTLGSALEKHQRRGDQEFAEAVELSGCLSLPMGALSQVGGGGDAKGAGGAPAVKPGEEQPNCGVAQQCPADSFPVHLFSGKGNSEGPKICVGGKYVIAKGLNDGGRGINLVIVDPKTHEVVRVGHFDTYAEDSSNLEIFLEMLNEKDIILAVSHDDASKKLSDHAKQLLGDLGSGMIQNVKFRDVWGFAGQRGISGFAPSEQIEFAAPGSSWPKPIDKKMCVPTEIKGTKIKPDPLANKNEQRRKFCSKYDGYGDFCEADHVDESLTPAPLTDKSLDKHQIFEVPIVVIPGLNHNAVRMQLETLLMNPGIKTDLVNVMFDEKFDEPAALADVFKFKSTKLSSSTKYVFQVQKALDKVWELYPEAKYVIVLEEEVIVSPDFLYFLAQCLASVAADDTLMGVSAWNENGYEGFSTMPQLVHRTETFPGLAFLLKKSFYDSHMKDHMDTCCNKRSWDGWQVAQPGDYEMAVPDLSRVFRRPYEGLSEQADFLTELFNRKRETNLAREMCDQFERAIARLILDGKTSESADAKPVLENAAELTAQKYEASVETLLKSSTALDPTHVDDCLEGRGLGFYIPETSGKSYVVFFEQKDADDYDILSLLCKCFKLFHVNGYKPRGLHKKSLRFTFKGNHMFFIGSFSPYFSHKPTSYTAVARSRS